MKKQPKQIKVQININLLIFVASFSIHHNIVAQKKIAINLSYENQIIFKDGYIVNNNIDIDTNSVDTVNRCIYFNSNSSKRLRFVYNNIIFNCYLENYTEGYNISVLKAIRKNYKWYQFKTNHKVKRQNTLGITLNSPKQPSISYSIIKIPYRVKKLYVLDILL